LRGGVGGAGVDVGIADVDEGGVSPLIEMTGGVSGVVEAAFAVLAR
jgi:hypothetical protein